ncbi:MAG: hypothetical protein OXP73_01910 [Chloroflexota bacterium]|nr:hypothetical protein [Chloroflexota bacterium]
MSTNGAGQIYWHKEEPMRRAAQIPGLRLVVECSWQRWACTRRWGWAVYDQEGKRLAGSNPMRFGGPMRAIGGCVGYLRACHPAALEEALRGG